MIAKVGSKPGSKTYGLLAYLYGPGVNQEHSDARLVASWDGYEPDPAAGPPSELVNRLTLLANRLNEPVLTHQSGVKGTGVGRHVWHCSVRAAPQDRRLSDEDWAQIAGEIVHAGGIAPTGDPKGCRWIAVRHADDHIHLVATLRRLDGKRPHLGNDRLRLRAACNRIEQRFGLRPTAPADGTAAKRHTREELGMAERLGLTRPARTELAHRVRLAAAVSTSLPDFHSRLQQLGTRVGFRHQGEGPARQPVGYWVGLPHDPGRYSGRTLAPDLSLPRVTERWVSPSATGDHRPPPRPSASDQPASRSQQRAAAWSAAAHAIDQATAAFNQAREPERAAVASALGDLLTVAAEHAPGKIRAELLQAARSFERGSRVPIERAQNAVSVGLRTAARALDTAGRVVMHGQESGAVLALVVAATASLYAATAWFVQRRLQAQAASSATAVAHLHFAARLLDPLHQEADRVAAQRDDLHEVVRTALGGGLHAQLILTDTAWPTLAGQLQHAQRQGLDPVAVLAEVARTAGRGVFGPTGAGINASVLAAQVHQQVQAASQPGRAHSDAERAVPVIVRPGQEDQAHAETVLRALDQMPDIPAPAELMADPAWPELLKAVAALDRTGVDTVQAVREAAKRRGFSDAQSVVRVLHWRIARQAGSDASVARTRGPQARRRRPAQTPRQGNDRQPRRN